MLYAVRPRLGDSGPQSLPTLLRSQSQLRTHTNPSFVHGDKRNPGGFCANKSHRCLAAYPGSMSRGHHQIPASHMTVNILLITSPNSCPTKGGNRTQHARHVPSRPSGQPCLKQHRPHFKPRTQTTGPPRLLGADHHSTLNKKRKISPMDVLLMLRLTRLTQVPSKKKKQNKN